MATECIACRNCLTKEYIKSMGKRIKSRVSKRHLYTLFTAALFARARRWEQPKCPLTDKWMNKMWSMQTMEYYSALKRKELLTHATTRLNLEDTVISERSQFTKSQALDDSTYTSYWEWSHSERRKVGRWAPGAGGLLLNRCTLSQAEECSGEVGGDDHTTLRMHLASLSRALGDG